MRNLKILLVSCYVETLSFLRHKEAFFFGLIFPVFMFLLFGSIWGKGYKSYNYIPSLLTGVAGMTITSDSLFSIGPVIKVYRDNNILKMLRCLPFNALIHFIGIFISRIIAMLATLIILILTSVMIFGYAVPLQRLLFLVSGVLAGTVMFSFMGLIISFFTTIETGRGLMSFIFFVMLFLSGAFYPVFMLPRILKSLAKVLPMTHLLNFIRGDTNYLYIMLLWILAFAGLFVYVFYRKQVIR